MATITIFQSVTLDGVMQGPAGADEDTRGGFAARRLGRRLSGRGLDAVRRRGHERAAGALLFGRRTYEDLLGFWTTTPEPNPFTDVLVGRRSTSCPGPPTTELAYPNATLLAGEAIETVAGLKERVDADLTILGSGELVRALHARRPDRLLHPADPPDRARLGHPAVRRGGPASTSTLERSLPTTTGVLIAQYRVRR